MSTDLVHYISISKFKVAHDQAANGDNHTANSDVTALETLPCAVHDTYDLLVIVEVIIVSGLELSSYLSRIRNGL